MAGPWTRFGPTRQSFPWFLLFVPLASAAFLLVRDLPRFLRLRRSRLQPAIVATTFLVGRVGLDDEPIELHSAEDIVGADVRHRGSGERYSHSEVVLATRGGTFEFRTGSRVHADGFAAFLQHSAARRDRWREEGVLGQKARGCDEFSLER